MAARGSCFQNESQSKLSSGIVDILPTILHLLDVPVPEHVQGRVLHEIISESSEYSIIEMKRVTHEAPGAVDYQAKLEVTELGEHFYLEQGWVEEGLEWVFSKPLIRPYGHLLPEGEGIFNFLENG